MAAGRLFIIKHIRQFSPGMLDGRTDPSQTLIREFEEKIETDDRAATGPGNLTPEVKRVRVEKRR